MKALFIDLDDHMEIELIAETPEESQSLKAGLESMARYLERADEEEDYKACVISCEEWRE